MSDPERPKGPTAPTFEVPDLDLGALSQPARSLASPPSAGRVRDNPSEVAPNMFDEDAFSSGSAAIQISDDASSYSGAASSPAYMGSEIDLGMGGDFELEPSAGYAPPSSSGIQSVRGVPEGESWPTGKALAPEQVSLDAVDVKVLADYGDAPASPLTAPLYTYRVLTRQRELKKRLARTEMERAAAERERESALARLAEPLRPELEKNEQFRRLLEPLLGVERLAADRSRALSSSNDEYGAAVAGYEAELAKLASALGGERALQAEKQRACDEREASSKRCDAKLKRVQIEVRAVNQVLEQKLGPQGGRIPDPEKTQLQELAVRAAALEPEVEQARQALAQAKRELAEQSAKVDGLERSERQLSRQKQTLGQEFGKQIQTRSVGVTDAEAQRQTALAEIASAVLAMRGKIAVPKQHLDAIRAVDQTAQALQRRAACELAALDAYDRARYKQGFWLAASALALIALWLTFKVLASSTATP